MDSTQSTPSMSTPKSPVMTPTRRLRQQRERMRLFSQISLLATTVDQKIETILKIDDCPQVDDSSLILLSLPNGPVVSSEPFGESFHSFCITSQTGQRIYGGSYVFAGKLVVNSSPAIDGQSGDEVVSTEKAVPKTSVVYTTRALVALVVRPVVDQLCRCLEWCVLKADCNPRWIRCVAQIRLPPKGKCLQINLPKIRKSLSQKRSQEPTDQPLIDNSLDDKNSNNMSSTAVEGADSQTAQYITIFRPLTALPLFDYPLRRLFTEVLSVDQFLVCYCCALIESQILIMSSNYYTLMLTAEALTQLLNPFKWQHVYVPILPQKLGLHYLDAPTPYIMGINRSANIGSAGTQPMVGCLIDCDQNTVDVNVDPHLLIVPPFVDSLKKELEDILNKDLRLSSTAFGHQKSAALKRVTELAKKHNVINETFDYLEDLKLSQQIRVVFLKTIRKNILHKYQQFIITSNNKKDSIRFDAVAYLSDQPQSMRPFLQQFVETQMFVSFIDETAKQLVRKQKTFTTTTIGEQSLFDSLYDDDYEELDLSLFSDEILESRFSSAKQIDLQDLEQIPTLSSNNDNNNGLTVDGAALVTASPRTRRRLLAQSPRHLPKCVDSSLLASPSRAAPAALTAQTNWRVVETLMREVKLKTKRILLEKMGSDEVRPLGCGTVGGVEENTLIAALCDLIERIWSHARTEDNKDMNIWQSGKCSFWSHLMAYYQLETNDVIDADTKRTAGIDSSQLTPALSQISIDSSSTSVSTPSSPAKQLNSNPMKPLPTTLIYDIRSVCRMSDIKTDVGKSRAFIRLSLERKLLSKHLRTLLINQDLLITLYKRYAFLRCEEEREQFLTHLLTLNAVDLMCFTNTFTTSVLPYTLIIHGSTQMNGWFSITGSMGGTTDNYSLNSTNCYTFKHRNLGFLNTLTVCVNQSTKIFIEYLFVRNEVTNHVYKFHCNRWFGRNIDDGSTERVLIGELLTGSITDILKKTNPTRSSSIGRNWTRSSEQYSSKEECLSVEDLQTMLGENVNQIMKYYFNAQNNALSGGQTNSTACDTTGAQNSVDSSHELIDLRQKSRKLSPKILDFKSQKGPTGGHSRTHPVLSDKRFATHRPLHHNQSGTHTTSAKSLINLIFGERKLLWILTQIFYYGYKNRGRSSFRKQSYLWDYLLRIVCELKISRTAHKTTDRNGELFIDLIDSITNLAPNYGKDSKFALFLLLSLRDHHLSPAFLKLLSRPSLSVLFYESESFVRDLSLMTFLFQILNTFNDIDLTFESALTKGL